MAGLVWHHHINILWLVIQLCKQVLHESRHQLRGQFEHWLALHAEIVVGFVQAHARIAAGAACAYLAQIAPLWVHFQTVGHASGAAIALFHNHRRCAIAKNQRGFVVLPIEAARGNFGAHNRNAAVCPCLQQSGGLKQCGNKTHATGVDVKRRYACFQAACGHDGAGRSG